VALGGARRSTHKLARFERDRVEEGEIVHPRRAPPVAEAVEKYLPAPLRLVEMDFMHEVELRVRILLVGQSVQFCTELCQLARREHRLIGRYVAVLAEPLDLALTESEVSERGALERGGTEAGRRQSGQVG
jgi:hypothetical protein